MALVEFEISPEELGIDANTFEERFGELALFIENHAKAIVTKRKCYKEWRSWSGGRTKTEYAKEDTRLMLLYDDAERAQVKTYEALQIALMGEEAWLVVKRRAQEEVEEYEAQIQTDLDA